MIKLAVSSDNHLDVNRIMSTRALHIQASWLLRHDIDYYLYAGDLYNNFGRTRRYFAALQRLVGERVQIYYVLGNHDMLSHASYQDVEHLADPMYLHNQYVDLPGTDWRLIGNNGWYDYSFSDYAQQPQRTAAATGTGGGQKSDFFNSLRTKKGFAESQTVICPKSKTVENLPDDQCNDGQRALRQTAGKGSARKIRLLWSSTWYS